MERREEIKFFVNGLIKNLAVYSKDTEESVRTQKSVLSQVLHVDFSIPQYSTKAFPFS